MKILLRLFLLFFALPCSSQFVSDVVVVDTLNKKIPADLVTIVLQTLSHYPELEEISIDFIFDNSMHNSFMQAKPKPLTLFNKHENREYIVQMMTAMMINDTLIPIHDLPEKALMGWIGHEVAHIVDYEEMSALSIAWFSLQYVFSKKYVIKTEERVDIMAIEHGLGNEIIAMKEYILGQYCLPDAYRAKIRNIYMSPAEVQELMLKIEND
jgi:hypothetical protein